MTWIKSLIALTLVVSPASLGIASYTGAIDLPLMGADEPSYNGEVLETFEKRFDDEMATGELDLRIDHGQVRVVGWAENAYKVQVIQETVEDDNFSDHETQIEFTDNSQDDHLNLTLTVDRKGTYSFGADADGVQVGESRVERAIVAFVPQAVLYERVLACSGQAHVLSSTFHQVWEDVWPEDGRSGEEARTCLPAEESASLGGAIRINVNGSSDKGLNVTSGVENLEGQALWLKTSYGDISVQDASFEQAKVSSDHGDIEALAFSADKMALVSDYGDIVLEGEADQLHLLADHGDVEVTGLDATNISIVADYGEVLLEASADRLELVADHGDVDVVGSFDQSRIVADYGEITLDGTFTDGQITADHGDIEATLAPVASGTLEVTADHGEVAIHVPNRASTGYFVDAQTDHGDVTIALEDAEARSQGEDEDDDGEHVKARTRGFDDRAIQVKLGIVADHGDVLVTDGSEALETEDEEDDAPEEPEDPEGPEEPRPSQLADQIRGA